MKKKIAALLTAVMVMAMGTTAFAATSPTTTTTDTSTQEATTYANVSNGGVVIDGVVSDVQPTIEAVTNAQVEAAQAQAVSAVAPTAKVLQMVDVSLPVNFTKVQLTFNVSGVVAGQKIAVLHQTHDGAWEVITPDTVGNGTVTATFTSLSPVAFVAYNASAQTGENAPIFPIVAIVSLLGFVVCSKKVKFN